MIFAHQVQHLNYLLARRPRTPLLSQLVAQAVQPGRGVVQETPVVGVQEAARAQDRGDRQDQLVAHVGGEPAAQLGDEDRDRGRAAEQLQGGGRVDDQARVLGVGQELLDPSDARPVAEPPQGDHRLAGQEEIAGVQALPQGRDRLRDALLPGHVRGEVGGGEVVVAQLVDQRRGKVLARVGRAERRQGFRTHREPR